MRALVLLLIGALGACSSPSQSARTEPPPTDPPPKVEPRRRSAGKQLYQRGEPYTPMGEQDDRYTCQGSPEDEKACQAVRGPGYHCVLESPVGYWEGEIRCKGTRVTEWEQQQTWERLQSLSIPGCVCSCTDEYARAADALRERIDHCSRVP